MHHRASDSYRSRRSSNRRAESSSPRASSSGCASASSSDRCETSDRRSLPTCNRSVTRRSISSSGSLSPRIPLESTSSSSSSIRSNALECSSSTHSSNPARNVGPSRSPVRPEPAASSANWSSTAAGRSCAVTTQLSPTTHSISLGSESASGPGADAVTWMYSRRSLKQTPSLGSRRRWTLSSSRPNSFAISSTSSLDGSRRSTHSSIEPLRRRGLSVRASSCSARSPSKRIVLVTKQRSTGICSARTSL